MCVMIIGSNTRDPGIETLKNTHQLCHHPLCGWKMLLFLEYKAMIKVAEVMDLIEGVNSLPILKLKFKEWEIGHAPAVVAHSRQRGRKA